MKGWDKDRQAETLEQHRFDVMLTQHFHGLEHGLLQLHLEEEVGAHLGFHASQHLGARLTAIVHLGGDIAQQSDCGMMLGELHDTRPIYCTFISYRAIPNGCLQQCKILNFCVRHPFCLHLIN